MKSKTILLISPPEQHILVEAGDRIPLSLLYLGASLSDAGHIPYIIDLNHSSYKQLNDLIKDINPEFIGFTTSTPYYNWIINFTNHIKGKYPNIKLIAGGPHATVEPETLLDNFDYIVCGEGEKAIVDIVEGKIKDKIVRYPYEDNLDNIPMPAWYLVNMDNYGINQNGKRTMTILSSRSCPYNCFFCTKNILGPKQRCHSIDRVIQEIKVLKDYYGFKSFYFLDDCFTADKQRAKDLCRAIIKNKLNITYRAMARTDTVDEELMKLLKESGMDFISFGLEHFNNKVLELTQKGNTRENNIKAIKLAKKYGMKIRGSMIMNLPGASKTSMYECLEIAKKYDLDYADFYPLISYPGTQIWNNPKKYKMKMKDKSYNFYQTCGESNVSLLSMSDKEFFEILTDIRNKWKEFKGTKTPWESKIK